MKLGIDVNRHKEIIVKAVSAVLLLLLKHFKVSHYYLRFVECINFSDCFLYRSTIFTSLSSCRSIWCSPTVFLSFSSSSTRTSWLTSLQRTSKLNVKYRTCPFYQCALCNSCNLRSVWVSGLQKNCWKSRLRLKMYYRHYLFANSLYSTDGR